MPICEIDAQRPQTKTTEWNSKGRRLKRDYLLSLTLQPPFLPFPPVRLQETEAGSWAAGVPAEEVALGREQRWSQSGSAPAPPSLEQRPSNHPRFRKPNIYIYISIPCVSWWWQATSQRAHGVLDGSLRTNWKHELGCLASRRRPGHPKEQHLPRANLWRPPALPSLAEGRLGWAVA